MAAEVGGGIIQIWLKVIAEKDGGYWSYHKHWSDYEVMLSSSLVVTVTGWFFVNAIHESRIFCVASNVFSWVRSGCCKSWWIQSWLCTFPPSLVDWYFAISGGNRFSLHFFFWGFLLHNIQKLLNSVLSHCFVLKVRGSKGNQFSCSFARHNSNSQSPSSLLTVQHKIHFPWMLSLRNKSDRFWLLPIICAAACIPEVLTNSLEAVLFVCLKREKRIIF